MNRLRRPALAAIAAMALMAVVGASTASATVLCKNSTSTTKCTDDYASGTAFEATLTTGSTYVFETSGGTTLDTCTGSTIKGQTTNTGSSTSTLEIFLSSKSWGSCSFTTITLKVGDFEIHHIAGTDSGTLTEVHGSETTLNTIFGTCVYGSGSALNLGTLVGGNPAAIVINTSMPKISGNFACPSTGILTANYTVTSPKPLYVSAG